MNKRKVFFISDSTAITAKTMGHSLLSQFDSIEFEQIVLPYINSEAKAHAAVAEIKSMLPDNEHAQRPIIFDTLMDRANAHIFDDIDCLRFNMLDLFMKPLEQELGIKPSQSVGKAHGQSDRKRYENRMDAVHYAMENDDGGRTRLYDRADIILTGVSRCGKTPTCLYLALQYGIYAANYPITEDDLEELALPKALQPFKDKIFGLTITPERLAIIRNERRAESRYASLRQCTREVEDVEALMRRYGISFVDTTDSSVEEIAATILHRMGFDRY